MQSLGFIFPLRDKADRRNIYLYEDQPGSVLKEATASPKVPMPSWIKNLSGKAIERHLKAGRGLGYASGPAQQH
jgi:hypothetical protein